ncbi:Gfo/Idh/MocA family protein [Victivallis sp. Marseille-Q1083]|uniref:Gfo/Idh/MocA family protein n=1 Tax=Victivallis sp. Marseille-Q1083 TaxID=2717288 RepID=UPI001589A75F|nr:Gfo/Idh/MocA family oxidoreductase [Victivallis sp. Marseille-Q1083]
MAKLKAGVIGLGMGWGHLAGYASHPDVEVVAVADRIEAKREAAKKEFNLPKIYAEGIDMIRQEKLDILSVAVPNNQHKELTVAGLEAGAHVLCEKPMAMNTAEAEEMLAAAKKHNLKLGIDFSYRFSPQSRAMKTLVEDGRLGEIYYARSVWLRRRGVPGFVAGFNTQGASGSWFFDKSQSGGGPLIDLGVHRLDLALWLMGYPEPDWVMGSTYCKLAPEMAKYYNQNYTVEDLACAMIKFKNGATLELDASWAANIKENEQMSTRLLGDKGGLYQYNLNEGYTYDVEYYQEIDRKQFDCTLHPPVPEVKSAFHMFVDAVRDDKPFLVQPEEGVCVMRLLDAIYKSAATGQPVQC